MPDKWIIVAPDYTMRSCGPGMNAAVATAVGENLWEAFPGSEPVYRTVYDRAFRDGCAVATVAHAGAAVRVNCRRMKDGNLIVAIESLAIEGLCATVNRLLEGAPRRACGAPGAPATRRHLRVVGE